MIFRQLFDSVSSTYTYLLADEASRQALLIDPVLEHEARDLKLLDELGLKLKYILDTHIHADHITAAGRLRKSTGATTIAGRKGAACVDRGLADGEQIVLGDTIKLTVLETPGHTDDSVCYYEANHKLLFTGDTLLIRGNGRSDFQNGSANDLYDSLTEKLFKLDDRTTVYPGHDYKGMTCTTIGEEKKFNPRIAGKTRDEFIAIMNNLNLPRPKKIDEAVPANRECGIARQG